MNGTRGLLIATAAAFIVGCSAGLMGGILFMRFAGPAPHARFERGMRGGPPMMRRGPPGPGHEERTLARLERELELTPDQRQRLIAHLDRARQERQALHDSLGLWLQNELSPMQRDRWKEVEERTRRERGRRDRR